MRKLLIVIFSLVSMAFAAQTMALKSVQQKVEKILLYAAPNTNHVIEKLDPNAALIPIIDKGAWTKVADPRNGRVGWIQRQQVRSAREAFYRPDIQTVYISRKASKSGYPALNIVAYKNGKKVSPAKTKRMYQQIRKQQAWERNRMRQITSVFDDPYGDTFFDAPWYRPENIFPDQNDRSASASYTDPDADDLMS